MSRPSWSAKKSVSSLAALLTVTTAAMVVSLATGSPKPVDGSAFVLQGNGTSAPAGNNGNGNGNGGGNGTAPKAFTIKGTVTNVVPGVIRNLQLTISNPNNQIINVNALAAALQSVTKASDAPAGACTASTLNLTIGAWTGATFPVPANAVDYPAAGSIPVSMPGSVGQACIRADFILRYTGTAVQP